MPVVNSVFFHDMQACGDHLTVWRKGWAGILVGDESFDQCPVCDIPDVHGRRSGYGEQLSVRSKRCSPANARDSLFFENETAGNLPDFERVGRVPRSETSVTGEGNLKNAVCLIRQRDYWTAIRCLPDSG